MKNLFEADAGFTPGPWTIHNNIGKNGELGILADKAPCIIAVMCNREAWPAEAHANAMLISQAPAMLEALEKIAASSPGAAVRDYCRAVIAKAKGE